MTVKLFVDALVIASAAVALALAPRVLARRPDSVGAARRSVSPLVALAVVTGLVYVNQVLFTVYVLRVHAGDPSFIARYLPAGWFDLASANPGLRRLADSFPAPQLLAPSVLRVQAFLELPFVLLAFATVVRWLDADLYRRIARSTLLPLASVSYTAVFCLVEWDLRNPYTVDDLVVRAASAVLTPLVLARWAARDTGVSRTPASVGGLLLFIGSLGTLGVLVLVVYDTALLYNLGRLDDRLPLAGAAAAALTGLRLAASRVSPRSDAGLTLTFVGQALRHGLALFFVPALVVRYGVMFGSPLLAAGAGLLMAAVACGCAWREAPAETEGASDSGRLRGSLQLAGRLACALMAGAGAAYAVARLTPPSYYEVTLLSATATFLVTGVVACGLIDAWVSSPARKSGAMK
ncbi:hypothetical protein ACFYO2_20265 [Streptomyces sp. NPDC006602]|uniref:hypothetical protein n=1 Tax=Streptomyces sp. NPDC006602 TaxID=3364751 RepID=UPI0036BEB958